MTTFARKLLLVSLLILGAASAVMVTAGPPPSPPSGGGTGGLTAADNATIDSRILQWFEDNNCTIADNGTMYCNAYSVKRRAGVRQLVQLFNDPSIDNSTQSFRAGTRTGTTAIVYDLPLNDPTTDNNTLLCNAVSAGVSQCRWGPKLTAEADTLATVLGRGNTTSENITTTGTISGTNKRVQVDGNATLVQGDILGTQIYATAAARLLLPSTVTVGATFCVRNRNTTGTVIIRPDSSSRYIKLNGATLAAGKGIKVNSPAVSDFICLSGDNSTVWTTWGQSGTWASES